MNRTDFEKQEVIKIKTNQSSNIDVYKAKVYVKLIKDGNSLHVRNTVSNFLHI